MANKDTNKSQPSTPLSAISAAFVENRSFLKKFLTRFISQQHDIEDVVQEAYLRAYKAEQSKDKAIEQPKAFLFRVARNIALNELRSKARHVTDYIEDCDERVVIQSSSTLEGELEAQQHIGLYCESLAALPEQCRRVCLLRKVHGLSYKDIAQRMGLGLSSVEKHLIKGMLASRAYIKEREGIQQEVAIARADQRPRSAGHAATQQELD